MPNTIDVTIPVEPEAAAALQDARKREAIGRIVSRILRHTPARISCSMLCNDCQLTPGRKA